VAELADTTCLGSRLGPHATIYERFSQLKIEAFSACRRSTETASAAPGKERLLLVNQDVGAASGASFAAGRCG
jgi:hypothetical protein